MQVRNIRASMDAYEIAATGQVVERGGVVTVPDDLGLSLCDQPSNWAPDGEESVRLFVEFCRWVEAVHAAEEPTAAEDAERAASPFVPLEELPNPGLAALEQPAPAAAKRGRGARADDAADTAGED